MSQKDDSSPINGAENPLKNANDVNGSVTEFRMSVDGQSRVSDLGFLPSKDSVVSSPVERTAAPSLSRSSISSISNIPWPIGINRIPLDSGTLGVNSIAELVDGNSASSTSLSSPPSSGRSSFQIASRPLYSSTHPFRAPTSKEIPPVHLTPLKKIPRSEFATYLKETSREYDRFKASRAGSLDSFSEPVGPESSYVPSSTAPPLSSIPQVFFDPHFQLDNPRIFDTVIENPHHAPRLASNAILQEKLTWYIDTVELNLISQISEASASFFSALDHLRDIHQQAARCVEQIHRLRQDLALVDRKRANAGIATLKLRRQYHNMDILLQALYQISTIMEKADVAESLLHSNSLDTCLDTLDATEALLNGDSSNNLTKDWSIEWKYPVQDLRSVKGLSDLREGLCSLRTAVGDKYSTELSDLLLTDLRQHVESVSKLSTLKRLGRILDRNERRHSHDNANINTHYMDISQDLRSSLSAIISGLVRSDDVLGAFKAYRDAVVLEAKKVVRGYLPSQSDSISVSSNMTSASRAANSRSLAAQLRALSAVEFETMLGDIYASLAEFFRRLATQHKLLLDVTSSASSSVIDLNDLLNNVISTAQARMVRVLNVRRDQTATVTLQEFINFYTLNGLFLSECEAITGDPGTGLRAAVTGQTKQFVANFQRARDHELTVVMDEDLWKDDEVPADFQAIVDNIVASANSEPKQWTADFKKALQVPQWNEDSKTADGNSITPPEVPNGKKRPRNVFIEDSSFIVSKAAIQAISISEQYLKLTILLPQVGSEIVSGLADLLKKFNSKTCQLILGAGATRSAGLKHITAKHLALSSESLNIVITLIPFIRECSRRYLHSPAVLGELDKARREMQEHQAEVHGKFISMMADKAVIHCNALRKIDWSKPKDGPNNYIMDLVKETTILAKILKGILPSQTYLVS